MRDSPKMAARWRTAIRGAILCAVIGPLLCFFEWGRTLALRSYDIPFAFREVRPAEVVIIYLDENSYEKLNVKPRDFEARHHAELLDFLTRSGAKLVVFDIWFDHPDARWPESDAAFISAIRRNGKVVLLGESEPDGGVRKYPPWEGFKTNAAGWGVAPLRHDLEIVVRQFDWRAASDFALPWVAATNIQSGLPSGDEYAQTERWLNYYGPPGIFERVSYVDATNKPPGFYANRCVFIGSRTVSQYAREHPDQFKTPYTKWHSRYSTGVEIVATAFLNLIHDESLQRLPDWLEITIIALLGGVAGFFLSLCRPRRAALLGVLGAGLVAIPAIALVQPTHTWFPWMIPVVVQIPCAWAWSAWAEFRRSLGITAPQGGPVRDPGTTPSRKETTVSKISRVGEHELLRQIGEGAYGEVWLARNAVGMLQAVKIVHQRKFARPGPYEREFHGIEKFMPISRSHAGFVHILHVGRDDAEGMFYYMMELADDVTTGRTIAPETYTPRTLASTLRRQGPRPLSECIEVGLALSAALTQLHQSNLVHRDIKPANILFVNGVPKLGDIGLVTDTESEQGKPSFVGTPGFVPPEGPGAPAADVFGLGKLLYEAAVGWDAELFPELPTDLGDRPDQEQFLQFHEFLWRACEPDVHRRFASAALFHAELLKIQEQLGRGE